MSVAPYGTWVSPISSAMLANTGHPVSGATFVAGEVWWTEQRPDQGGRAAVRRIGPDGAPIDVLPAPWNARSRVHEYGGGAWAATSDGTLVFVEFADQRLYRLDPDGTEAQPLTADFPSVATGPAVRYGELTVSADEQEIWAVRETHLAAGVSRDLVAVALDGSGVRVVLAGSDFLAGARVSPNGRRVAWIAWNHPQMPWDGTELRVADLAADGTAGPARVLLGSTTESVVQPAWADDGHLYVISDRSGWWNLYRLAVDGPDEPEPVGPVEADLGGPLWMLGTNWYRVLDDGRILAVRTLGTDRLGWLDPAATDSTEPASWHDLEVGDLTSIQLGGSHGAQVCITADGARTPRGVRVVDVPPAGSDDPVGVTDIRLSVDELPDRAYLPSAEAMTFTDPSDPGGQPVHAIVYPPTSPDHVAPVGELPPYVTLVHGGPTSQARPHLGLDIAYLTSRGIGVIDVNYGGSTGYGRDYRRRLNGQWGVVDVADTVTAVRGLVAAGLADPARLAIEGGSAGGWTVLSALTQTTVFACGISYYGVTDLLMLAADTHDFESRYLDGLVGPLPEARALYEQRAPVNNLAGLSCPVLLLQGLDDPVVPPSQAEKFRDALAAKGIPHAYRAYAGESHGFRRRETIIDATEASLSFLGQIMGFEPPDVSVLELSAGDRV